MTDRELAFNAWLRKLSAGAVRLDDAFLAGYDAGYSAYRHLKKVPGCGCAPRQGIANPDWGRAHVPW